MELSNITNEIKAAVGTKTPLADIVNVFCEKCTSSFLCKTFVFDTGIYELTCDELFCFSLICEYQNGQGEICVQIAYPPCAEIYAFSCRKKAENAAEFKKTVFESKEFELLKNKNALKISVSCD